MDFKGCFPTSIQSTLITFLSILLWCFALSPLWSVAFLPLDSLMSAFRPCIHTRFYVSYKIWNHQWHLLSQVWLIHSPKQSRVASVFLTPTQPRSSFWRNKTLLWNIPHLLCPFLSGRRIGWLCNWNRVVVSIDVHMFLWYVDLLSLG